MMCHQKRIKRRMAAQASNSQSTPKKAVIVPDVIRQPEAESFFLWRDSTSTAVKRSARAQYDLICFLQITGKFKNCLKKGWKIKLLLEKEALNVEYLWKSSYLFTSAFIVSYFVLSLYFKHRFLTDELRFVSA